MADSFQKKVWDRGQVIDKDNLNRIENGIEALYTNLNSITTQIGSSSDEDSIVNKINALQSGKADKSEINSLTTRVTILENASVDLTEVEKTLGVKLNTNLTEPSEILDSSLYSIINTISEDLDSSITEVNRRMNTMELRDSNILSIIGGTERNGYYGDNWTGDATKKNLHTRISVNETDISTLKSTKANATDLENKVTTTQLTEGLSGKVDNSAFTTLQGRVSANEAVLYKQEEDLEGETHTVNLRQELYNIASSNNQRMSNLELRDSDITKIIGGNVNQLDGYYGVNWDQDNTKNDLHTRILTNETDISTLKSSVYRQEESTLEPGTYITIDKIAALNEAIFGSSSGGTSSGSLINKVEKAMGRSLDLEPNETADGNTGEYSNSLATRISNLNSALNTTNSSLNEVRGILGMAGGSAAGTSNIIESLTDLETAQSNLITAQNELSTAVGELSATVDDYSALLDDLSGAYRDADIRTYGENAYLILKYDTSEADAENAEDITNKHNKYLQLPLMGGGGGTAYELDASFINRTFPTNNIITVGDAYNVRFTWQVTQGTAPDVSNVSIDGTLTIRLNGVVVDTLYIMSNTPLSYNLGNYISTSGRNVFTITATNAAVPSRTLYTTVVSYSAILESTFDPSVVQTESSISYTYIASIGSGSIEKELHVFIDNVELTLTGNSSITESSRTISFPTPSEGDHLVEVYFTANVGTAENPNIIYSNRLIYGILCGSSLETRIATNFTQTEVNQYDNLIINYLVVTPNQATTRVEFYFGDTETPIVEEVNTTYQQISYPVTQSGGEMTIRIVAGRAEKILTVTVLTNTLYDFSYVDSQLQAYFTPGQKTNASSNRNTWENSVENPTTGYNNITGQLENFLYYNTNNFDGWLRDENGQSFLRLRNRDKVTINLPIFNFNIDANEKITDGMTFEVDFKTSDVTNYAAEIISCYEEGLKNSKNIIFTAQEASLNNSVSLKTQYKEEERLTVAFVVENSSNGPLYQLFKVYINGILSGSVQYESTSLNFTIPSNGKIVLGSEECTLDIYSIRFYNRALTFQEIIKNKIANLGTYSDKIASFNRNNYQDTNGRISYTAFQQASPTTPYMVITGEGDWNDEDGLHAMPTTKSAGTFSTSDKGIKIVYTDPVTPSNSFTSDFEGGEVGVAIQGTSSQEYKRKNYKIKLTNFMQNGILHKKKVTDSDYDITYEEVNGEQQEVSRKLKNNIVKEGYKLSENSLPTYTFCIKADVASSENANNTLLVNIYDTIVRQVELTPPQGDNSKIREGVEGYPMIVWYYNNVTQTYTFLGKYNFNNDKGTEEVYGFEEGDESWEVGNNEKLLCFFDESEDPNWENWRTAFETRYPDDDKSMTKEEDAYTDAQIANRLAGLRQLVHWVSDNVDWVDNNKEAVIFNNEITEEDIALAASTGRTPALEAFRREFKQYFNLDLMTFFFVYTEFFLMVDNRAKNMFMTRYRANLQRPSSSTESGAAWHAAYGDNIVELDASTSTKDTYSGWFSLPYDMDTSVGTNNVGVYKFNYGYETGDYQPDGSVVFNGQKSKLWVAFIQAFPNEIRNMYITFSNNISYTALENAFEKHQGVWSETVFNEDMIAKYIDWITSYDSNNNPLTRDDRALPMLLGSKEEQRKWWLENRFIYFNSKYALNANTDAISLGVRKAQLNIPVTVYADAYVTFKVGAQDPSPTTIRIKVGETKTITRNTSNETGAGDRVESTLSPASRIRSVENLADLQLNNADFSRATKLQILRIGSALQENSRLTSINLSGNTLLRLFDLRNCTNYSNDLSISNCLSLENLYLAGTKITNVILPAGGILKTIQYPTTISNITIINQPYLTNLIIGDSLPADEIKEEEENVVSAFINGTNDYSNIQSLYLNNAGQINSLEIVQAMSDSGYLYLADIDWTMTTAEFMALFDKIDAMYGFIGTQASAEVQSYIAGILHLTTLPSTADIEKIARRFSNLKLYYRDEENVDHEYYTIRFYDPYNNLILDATQYVAGGGDAVFNTADYFTDEYLEEYNKTIDQNWVWGSPTRLNFEQWDTSIVNIQSDLEVHPVMTTEYRISYILQTPDITQDEVRYDYYFEDRYIEGINVEPFEKDYYKYTFARWTLDSVREADSIQTGDERVDVPTASRYKTAESQYWYAVYNRTPQIYNIKLYNTNAAGEKQGEPLLILERAVVSGGTYTDVIFSDISAKLPINDTSVIMVGDTTSTSSTPDEERTYRYLNIKPYVPNTSRGNGLKVTGNMDLLITYYKIDDIFTNYFLNKLTTCDLGSITTLPPAAFFHNTNLIRLKTAATQIGEYSFVNTVSNNRKIYIFTASDINFNRYCFHSMQNAIILFTGSGNIRVNNFSFNNLQNCSIIVLNSNIPITTIGDRSASFSNFINNNNRLYVTDEAYNNYPNFSSTTTDYSVPNGLIESERARIIKISNGGNTYAALMEEVGTI